MSIEPRINELQQPIGQALDNWGQRSNPPRTVMVGRYCRVEPLQPQYAEALFAAFGADSDGRNWTYMPYGPFEDFDSFEQWLHQQCQGKDPLFYCIIDKATDQPVGMASYLRIEPAVGVIEVGHIHFSPRLQRTALATETMYLMMRRVFDELGYRRYEWKCDNLNQPSRQAAKRLGFQFEGVFRQATIYKGRNRDTAWFSVLDSEWPKLKAAFELWLAPQNFGTNGEQRQRLQEFRD